MTRDSRKSLILLLVCTSLILAVLATVSWPPVASGAAGSVAPSSRFFELEALSIYLSVFLITDAALTDERSGFAWLAIIPAAVLLAVAIVFVPLHEWLMYVSFALHAVFALISFGMLGPLGPPFVFIASLFVSAYLTGMMTSLASRLLTGRTLRGVVYDPETVAHTIGFALGSLMLVGLAVLGIGSAMRTLTDPASLDRLAYSDYFGALWIGFLVAPGFHLASIVVHRLRHGWPTGRQNGRRLLLASAILFLTIGVGRSITEEDPLMVVVWPAHDLADLFS